MHWTICSTEKNIFLLMLVECYSNTPTFETD